MERPKIPTKYLFIADKVHKRKGLYRSAYALKLALDDDPDFKKKYDMYLKEKPKVLTGQRRWFEEEWISVRPFIESGKIIRCGDPQDKNFPACRPLKRITKDTPITINELLEKTTKSKILKEVEKKEKNPNYRIDWNSI
jgi:hypothetical protein